MRRLRQSLESGKGRLIVMLAAAVSAAGGLAFFIAAATSGMTVVVDDSSDSTHGCQTSGVSPCSLRDAILFANSNPGSTIHFNISGAGVHTFSPASALPTIAAPTTIDGYTQPGASANSLAAGDNAVLLIEIDGSGAGNSDGLTIGPGGGGTSIRGLVIGNFSNNRGVMILAGADGNTIAGNFIGTDPSGTAAHLRMGKRQASKAL